MATVRPTLTSILCAAVLALPAAAATLTEDAKLLASDGAAYDDFGWSVSVSGETAVVGAWADDDNGDSSGSAYVFDGPWEPAVTPFAGGCAPGAGGQVGPGLCLLIACLALRRGRG